MCNLFNLYYLLVLFHLLKVFVSIAFVSNFLSLFIAYKKCFNWRKVGVKLIALEGGYEGNGLFLFSSKHKLDGSSSAQLPEFTREAFQVMVLSCPKQ